MVLQRNHSLINRIMRWTIWSVFKVLISWIAIYAWHKAWGYDSSVSDGYGSLQVIDKVFHWGMIETWKDVLSGALSVAEKAPSIARLTVEQMGISWFSSPKDTSNAGSLLTRLYGNLTVDSARFNNNLLNDTVKAIVSFILAYTPVKMTWNFAINMATLRDKPDFNQRLRFFVMEYFRQQSRIVSMPVQWKWPIKRISKK